LAAKFQLLFFHQSQDKKQGDKIIFDDDQLLIFKNIIGYDRFIGFSGSDENKTTSIDYVTSGKSIDAKLYRNYFFPNFYFFLHCCKIWGNYDLSLLNIENPRSKVVYRLFNNLEDAIELKDEMAIDLNLKSLCRLWTEDKYLTRIKQIKSEDPFEMLDRVETVISRIISNYQYQYIKEL